MLICLCIIIICVKAPSYDQWASVVTKHDSQQFRNMVTKQGRKRGSASRLLTHILTPLRPGLSAVCRRCVWESVCAPFVPRHTTRLIMAHRNHGRRKAALLCILAAGKIIKDSAKVGRRKVLVKDWLLHKECGGYSQICRELEKIIDFKNYLRMSPGMFRLLLTKVSPLISKDNTNM